MRIYLPLFLVIIQQIAFESLKFNRIYTETFDMRPNHISILEKNGFKLEGRLRSHNNINGIFYDSLIHGVLKIEYENR